MHGALLCAATLNFNFQYNKLNLLLMSVETHKPKQTIDKDYKEVYFIE